MKIHLGAQGLTLQGKKMKWAIEPWNETYLILENTAEWMNLSGLEFGVLSPLNRRESKGEEEWGGWGMSNWANVEHYLQLVL